MLYKLSSHAIQHRSERLFHIITYIGLGEHIMCSSKGQKLDRYEALTDTGVLLVLTKDNLIITAYIASIDKATAIWRSCYKSDIKMPIKLYKTILQNQQYKGDKYESD